MESHTGKICLESSHYSDPRGRISIFLTRVMGIILSRLFESWRRMPIFFLNDTRKCILSFLTSFNRYYGGGISSVYMWDNNDIICGCFMVLNGTGFSPRCHFVEVPREKDSDTSGSWHSIHIIEIIPDLDKKTAEYRLTTSIQLYLTLDNQTVGTVKQNGTITRQQAEVHPFSTADDHLEHIGQMIEQMENKIRSNLDLVYMSKNQETVDAIRILHSSDIPQRSLLAELAGRMKPKEY